MSLFRRSPVDRRAYTLIKRQRDLIDQQEATIAGYERLAELGGEAVRILEKVSLEADLDPGLCAEVNEYLTMATRRFDAIAAEFRTNRSTP